VYQRRAIPKDLWGELKEEDEEDELDDEDLIEEDELSDELDDIPVDESADGMKSGISSVLSGTETPDIDIRKTKPTYSSNAPRPLYEVLEEVDKDIKP
jgi:hypothetical protein